MKQLDLKLTAKAARDLAIDRAELGASSAFLENAYLTLQGLAERRSHFTSDDVWDNIARPLVTGDKRALGAVMNRARRDGLVEPTSTFVCSKSRVNHARPLRVWRSLVFTS